MAQRRRRGTTNRKFSTVNLGASTYFGIQKTVTALRRQRMFWWRRSNLKRIKCWFETTVSANIFYKCYRPFPHYTYGIASVDCHMCFFRLLQWV